MPFYSKQGHIPAKRHTVFKKYDGSLLYEELMSREGFSYVYSNLYHIHMPTQIIEVGKFSAINFELTSDKTHRPRHIRTSQMSSSGDIVSSRKSLFFNEDVNKITWHDGNPTNISNKQILDKQNELIEEEKKLTK